MNDKNQKVLRGIAIAVLGVVFAAFVILYLTGRIGEFSGFTNETPESSAPAAVSANAPVVSQTASVPASSQSDLNPVISSVAESSVISSTSSVVSSTSSVVSSEPVIQPTAYRFRNQKLLDQHYEKHGREMGFASAKDYEKAAAAVPNHPDVLHKIEKEDGDDVYYVEATNEFVVISTDGYIRTYFNPDRGIDYYNKQ